MNPRYSALALLACSLLPHPARADAAAGIEPNTVEFSLALGYGVLESPIVFEPELTFHALPSLVWYGERAYFDNGLFGYALAETKAQQWDLVLYPNEDGLLFNLNGGSALVILNVPLDPNSPVTVVERNERDISAMAGVRYSRIGETWRGHVELAGDVTGVHQGWELGSEIGFAEPQRLGPVWLDLFLGIRFKDADLVDYYYTPELGEISPLEGEFTLQGDELILIGPYNGETGWLAHVQLDVRWPLAERWAVRATVRYNQYSESIADSLLVTRDHFSAGFAGIEYRF